MRVDIRLFAVLRERAGTDLLSLDLAEGALVADALAELRWLTGDLHAVMAVNRDYATDQTPLTAGDELALIPPVSGGSEPPGSGVGGSEPGSGAGGSEPGSGVGGGSEPGSGVGGSEPTAVHVRITDEALSLDAVSALVRDARAGAVVTFQGVTRDVPSLEYEAYLEMAEAKIADIVRAAVARHGLCAAAVEHRIGTVPLSEPSVVIAVSAPHRAEAFAGAREVIDELKASVPIWKREEGEWISGQPPRP